MDRRMTINEFIEKADNVHGNKYDYSKVEYVNNHTKVCIVCSKHGEFWQTPNSHLQGHGCPKCKDESNKKRLTKTFEEFVERARNVHGNKYAYSKETYSGIKQKTLIKCPIHGYFEQRAEDHLRGHGCSKCNCLHKTTDKFIEEATKTHKGFYTYEKTVYKNKLTKIIITCPIHGDFEQIPANHLKGCKCPKCAFSKLEKKVERVLDEENIEYDYQKKFKWLGRQKLDFYLPKYNIAIECQGIQHFVPNERLGGEDGYTDCVKRDKAKKRLCKENNVRLLYYTDLNAFSTFLDESLIKS